ncbi:MAG: hypothetical protein ACO3SO_08760, partial [Luteolibacter sp.]
FRVTKSSYSTWTTFSGGGQKFTTTHLHFLPEAAISQHTAPETGNGVGFPMTLIRRRHFSSFFASY